MAKITVYKGKPHLTLLSWLGMACILGSVAQLPGKMITSAYFSALFGVFLCTFAHRRAASGKMRITGKAASLWIFGYYAASLIQKILIQGLDGLFTFSDWTIILVIGKNLVGILVAVLLLLPSIRNKPMVAACGCFGILALSLYSCVTLLTVDTFDPLLYILVTSMLFPAIPGLILLLRGRKMSIGEKAVYVF